MPDKRLKQTNQNSQNFENSIGSLTTNHNSSVELTKRHEISNLKPSKNKRQVQGASLFTSHILHLTSHFSHSPLKN